MEPAVREQIERKEQIAEDWRSVKLTRFIEWKDRMEVGNWGRKGKPEQWSVFRN